VERLAVRAFRGRPDLDRPRVRRHRPARRGASKGAGAGGAGAAGLRARHEVLRATVDAHTGRVLARDNLILDVQPAEVEDLQPFDNAFFNPTSASSAGISTATTPPRTASTRLRRSDDHVRDRRPGDRGVRVGVEQPVGDRRVGDRLRQRGTAHHHGDRGARPGRGRGGRGGLHRARIRRRLLENTAWSKTEPVRLRQRLPRGTRGQPRRTPPWIQTTTTEATRTAETETRADATQHGRTEPPAASSSWLLSG